MGHPPKQIVGLNFAARWWASLIPDLKGRLFLLGGGGIGLPVDYHGCFPRLPQKLQREVSVELKKIKHPLVIGV